MRKIPLIISVLLFLFLSACANFNNSHRADPLLGTWKTQSPEESYLVFKENNILDILDGNMKSLTQIQSLVLNTNITTKYESITEIDPHQLYIIVEFEGRKERTPFGIYKIENDKLIISSATEYHRSIGFIDAGVSRYEQPKDFSGFVTVFEKID